MAEIDLNLLSVFDALYDLRSVTRAAARLNLTQSAVSHALRRLRDTVGDPLFVRNAGTLQPTARATAMAADVREGLAQIRTALSPTSFAPATTRRRFTIAAGSYFCALLVPRLVEHGRGAAPGAAFRIVPVDADLLTGFDDGTIDIALGAFSHVPARLGSRTLFREDLVWVASITHPLAGRPVTPAELIGWPRLHIGTPRPFAPPRTRTIGDTLEAQLVSEALATAAPDAEGTGMVYDSLTAIDIVARTDMLACVPRRIARIGAARGDVVLLETDIATAGVDLVMVWPTRTDRDAGIAWLRDAIVSLTT